MAFVAGKTVNPEMVKAGYAAVYRGGFRVGFDSVAYCKAEGEAKTGEKGISAIEVKYVSLMERRKARSANLRARMMGMVLWKY